MSHAADVIFAKRRSLTESSAVFIVSAVDFSLRGGKGIGSSEIMAAFQSFAAAKAWVAKRPDILERWKTTGQNWTSGGERQSAGVVHRGELVGKYYEWNIHEVQFLA